MTDLTPEYLSSITDAGFHHAVLAIQDLTAENERLKAELAKVKDPNAIHINMLRGDIAKPMWAQIKHIYAEARLAQGEPSAWQWRHRERAGDDWTKWSHWKEGKASYRVRTLSERYQFEERPLYAALEPHPLNTRSVVSQETENVGDKVRVATHRHKKRGSTYALIGIGKMQAERWVVDADNSPTFYETVDMREVAIYRGTDDGEYWVRPREEFEDGRFEAIGGKHG